MDTIPIIVPLIGGPYRAPRINRGDVLHCEARGEDVIVGGFTDAPIPWPRVKKTGKPSLIVCGNLVDALHLESEQAISHHWGVGTVTIWKWRQALGIGRVTPGTSDLLRQNGEKGCLQPEVAAKGRIAAKSPQALAKMAQAKRGKPAHPNTRNALLHAAKKPKSAQWKAEHSERMREQWATGVRRGRWTPAMDLVFRYEALSDRRKAALIGVSLAALRGRRMTIKQRQKRMLGGRHWAMLRATSAFRHKKLWKFPDTPSGDPVLSKTVGPTLDELAELE